MSAVALIREFIVYGEDALKCLLLARLVNVNQRSFNQVSVVQASTD